MRIGQYPHSQVSHLNAPTGPQSFVIVTDPLFKREATPLLMPHVQNSIGDVSSLVV